MESNKVTVWRDDEGFHLIMEGNEQREFVYPKHQHRAFMEVVLERMGAAEGSDDGE